MARQTRRRATGALGEETWLLLAFLATAGVVVLVWIALSLGSWCAGLPIVTNPLIAVLEVLLGRHRWPWQSTAIGAVIASTATGVTLYARRRWPRRSGIDTAARTMDPPGAITLARRQDNATAAKRLLRDAPKKVQAMTGPPLGTTVLGGVELFLPAEQSLVIAAGQRTGKTMAWAIPAVLCAWGPVLATSNRPDLYQHTVAGAEKRGTVWMCDLQAVTGTPQCGFWVNLLAQVRSLPAARKLASFFVSAASGSATERSGAKVDSYFDGGAQELLGLHMFAAACIGGDLLHVSEWLSADQDQTPALILRAKGHPVPARRILDAQSLYARQRDGLYDMARRFLNTLSDEGYAQMVTPSSRTQFSVYEGGDGVVIDTIQDPITHQLPEFKPAEFITSTDTLYALSIAGPDSAAALTAALVGQILEAALKTARSRRGGRLAVPLLAVLEEAANCARLDELPSYYTYAAGSGVILMTILQVIEQGEDLWSINGLRTMRAQSIEIFGGNIANDSYLEQWARLIDDHDVADYSRSVGPGGVNRTTSWRPEPILNIAKLNKLPRDRALIRLPGHEPILIKKHFWWDNPDLAPIITTSLQRFNNNPGADAAIGSLPDGKRQRHTRNRTMTTPPTGPAYPPPTGAGGAKQAPIPPKYRDFVTFAENWLFPFITTRLAEANREQTMTWCTQWWRHRPVSVRIAHLHNAFEATRRSRSGSAVSTYLLSHIDAHFRVILDAANGPLHRCTRTKHVALQPLPYDPVPPGWFGPPPKPVTDKKHPPRYAHYADFVEHWLLPVTAVRISGNNREGQYTWCRQWWAHHGVALRFAALHAVFEAARTADDKTAMSTLFVNHIDPHMRHILEAANGPLHRCTPDRHIPHPGLAAARVPPNWFGLPGATPPIEELGFGPDFRSLRPGA